MGYMLGNNREEKRDNELCEPHTDRLIIITMLMIK